MFLAESAIFLHFNTIRIVLLIFHRIIVSLLAFCTCKNYFSSHVDFLRFTSNFKVFSVSYTHLDVYKRQLMIYTLNTAGFEAEGFAEGESMFEALMTKKPQLIMLDIMLPGEDGITILKKLRANPKTSHVPIIMATAKGTEYDKVIGLDMGADDYLTKPFGMMEMISRIKAVLRRSAPAEESKTCLLYTSRCV